MTVTGQYTKTAILEVAGIIVSGCAAALTAQSSGGAVNRSFVTLGEVAWDNCQCGQLALTITRIYLSQTFPQDASRQQTRCPTGYVVADCSLSIVRCVPGPDTNGNPPKEAALTAAAGIELQDAFVVWDKTECILMTMYSATPYGIMEYIMLDQTSLGPQGNCGGTELHFKIGFNRAGICCG